MAGESGNEWESSDERGASTAEEWADDATGYRVARLVETVTDWPGVRALPHRYGGTEFRLGPREIGHVHTAGIVDVAFTRRLRDLLVAERLTSPHHIYPDSGWTTYFIADDSDIDGASRLLDLSYCYHHRLLGHRRGTRLPAVDVDGRLDSLAFSPTIRRAFDELAPEIQVVDDSEEPPVRRITTSEHPPDDREPGRK